MRIGRAMIEGSPRIVVQTADGIRAAPGQLTMEQVISDWPSRRSELADLADPEGPTLEPDGVQWLPPVMPDKLICVGTNYSDHVAEMEAVGGPKAPGNPWPFGFLKPPRTALVGHEVTVTMPGYAERIDWEAELAVIIGDGSKATGDEPLQAVFGYSVFNDLSVRDYVPLPHALGLDAIVSKGFDQSAPMGPWIVTADEIDDPQDLAVRLRVNGVTKQDSSTSQMIFGVREILSHFGRVLTLSPGDVIATGTPSGVGMGRRPPEMLSTGDIVEAEIDGVGLLRTTLGARRDVELLRV